MSENVTTVSNEVHYMKDFNDDWGDSKSNNIAVDQELTVTITLNEHRKLVSDNAVHSKDISAAEHKEYELKEKIKELKEDNEGLRKTIQDNSVRSAIG